MNLISIDTQPPRVDKCVSPAPFIKTSDVIKVKWEEPLFSDNSHLPVKIEKSHTSPSNFPLGKTDVVYTVWDKAGNNNTCTILIEVKGQRKSYMDYVIYLFCITRVCVFVTF